MNKKLLVVLVIVAAMLISFSLVMGAKKAIQPPDAQRLEYVKPVIAGTVQAVPVYTGPQKAAAAYSQVQGAPTEILAGPVDRTKSLCDLSRAGYWGITNWIWGDEKYAHYEDPEAFGCTDPYPFRVTEITFGMQTYGAEAFSAFISVNDLDLTDPACPKPGSDICVSPTYNISIPAAGYYLITLPLEDLCCVYGPYFAEFYIIGAVNLPDAISDDAPLDCHSYNDWGYGWRDLVVSQGWPGCVQLMSKGLTMAHPPCPPPVPPPCRLQLDQGPAWRVSFFQPNGVANYFDAEWCGASNYPFRVDSVLFRVTASAVAFPITVKIGFYGLAGLDSCGGPGTELYSELVTLTGGGYWSVPLSSPFCAHGPFYGGIFMASSDVGDTLMPNFSSDLLGPDTCKTYAFWGGVWYNWSEFWGYPTGIGHLVFRVIGSPGYLSCPQLPCTTTTQVLSYYISPSRIWALPSTSGRNYPNERFTVPMSMVAGARLDEVRLLWYNLQGDPNPTIYVWADDGTGVPYDPSPPNFALASYNIPTASVVTFPTMQIQSTWQTGLHFNPLEEFHVGYSFGFDPGDTLSMLSDDYADVNNIGDRASWYWPTGVWENTVTHFGIYMNWIMEAVLCPNPPGESTFVMACKAVPGPYGFAAAPGDVNKHAIDITAAQIMNYNIPVTLSLLSVTPPVNITANFVPNGVAPPFVSAVSVTVDPLVAYNDYILTFQAVGSDGQTKTCDVTLKVGPPYDEGIVNFYHGIQRSSNFGLIGEADVEPNFTWYGFDPLYAATIVSAMTSDYDEQEDHMHLVYGGCDYPFTPTQRMTITPDIYGEVAYSQFFTEQSRIPGEYDSLFIIGLKNVESTDFSIKIKIYYNPTANDIPELWTALYEDWDVSSGGTSDLGDMDTLHNMMWQYSSTAPDTVYGAMRVPFDDSGVNSMVFLYHQQEVYPTTADSCFQCGDATPPQPGGKYLFKLMSQPGYRYIGYWGEGPDDHSMLITGPPFSLNPDEKHIEMWIDFGFAGNFSDPDVRRIWYHRVLRYAGFYRGDVNASDSLEIPSLDVTDLVYLINYLFLGGAAPKPFKDQGDVNADRIVDIRDVVYMINFHFIDGPAPRDYVRFIPSMWDRPSLFLNDNWH
jgi:hypothetical protein